MIAMCEWMPRDRYLTGSIRVLVLRVGTVLGRSVGILFDFVLVLCSVAMLVLCSVVLLLRC